MIKHKEQRVGVFVDAQNMYHSARNLFGKFVNFEAVLEHAVAGRRLVRAIAYGIISPSADEAKFLDALKKQGFEVRVKDLQVYADGTKKGDWDVGLAVDAIKLADKLDAVVLVTGDGDFVPLVEYLRENKGCLVEVVSFAKSTSGKLLEIVDDHLDMGESPATFLLSTHKLTRGAAPTRTVTQRSTAPRPPAVRTHSQEPRQKRPARTVSIRRK